MSKDSLGLERHNHAAHDLALIELLLLHHTLLVEASYSDKQQFQELKLSGMEAVETLRDFKKLLCQRAHEEFHDEDFPEYEITLENYSGSCWPPTISSRNEEQNT